MDELVEALQIFLKYDNPKYPTHCKHDVLYVFVNANLVSEDDIKKLDELGFIVQKGEYGDDDCFISFRYGSA